MKLYIFRGLQGEQVPDDTTHLVIHNTVSEIPQGLCMGNTSLLSVVMDGDHVTSIHHNAFRNCRSIRHVRLSCRLLYIGMWAFCGCAEIETLAIPSSVKVVEYEAFMLCRSLRLLQFPSDVKFVGDGVVRYCENLLPESITSHDEYKTLSREEREEETVEWLSYRFEDYPLHRLCLDASVSSRAINRYTDKNGKDEAFTAGEDDMMPLHIVAMNPNALVDSVLVCFHLNPGATFVRDRRGLNPIDHALRNNSEALTALITTLCVNGE